MSTARAWGGGIALAVVAVTYEASGIGFGDRWWAGVVAIGLGVALADALDDVRRGAPVWGVAPASLVAVLVAAYLCVPETDQFVVGAVVPVTLVALEVVARRAMPVEWYAVAAGSVGWASLYGAAGRPSALAGALFAWWAVLLPGWVFARAGALEPWRRVAVLATAAGAAAVMARTGGLADTNATIVVAALAYAAVSFAVCVAVAPSVVRRR